MHIQYKPLLIATAITSLSAILLSSSIVSADDTNVIDQVSLTVPIACTMTGTGTTHTATLDPGTYSGASGSEYENGIGKTTLTAICNDDNGFSIYAVGYTGNSLDSTNHTKLVGNNTSGLIDTAVYSNNDTTSSWSMRLTKVLNPVSGDPVTYNPQNLTITTGYDTWHAVPSTYTKVAEYKANTGSSTTDTTLGVKLETTYAAYVTSNQSADVYEGQVKYTMVHPYTEEPLQPQPSTARCINYHANASDAVGTMGCQSATDGNSIMLLASNFSRTGYGFAGWSDKFDYATNAEAKFYGPQETITVPTGTTANGLSLYAVWVKSQGSIQDQSKVASVCNSLTTAPTNGTANLTSVSALTDQRDNNTYAIAKLADGKCWMIENLRLESTNSDNSTGALAQGYGTSATYGNFSGLAKAESTYFFNSTTANSLYYSGTQDGIASIDIGTTSYPGYRMPRYNNWNNQSSSYDRPQNPTANSDINSTTNAGMYSFGNYYTWHAAIADLTYAGTNNNSSDTTSICPIGWRLPRGGQSTVTAGQNGDFYVLTTAITGMEPNDTNLGYAMYYGIVDGIDVGILASNSLRKYPNNFLYPGYFGGSLIHDVGNFGLYWASTTYDRFDSYDLYLDNSYVNPGTNYGYKYYGYSIRCTMNS